MKSENQMAENPISDDFLKKHRVRPNAEFVEDLYQKIEHTDTRIFQMNLSQADFKFRVKLFSTIGLVLLLLTTVGFSPVARATIQTWLWPSQDHAPMLEVLGGPFILPDSFDEINSPDSGILKNVFQNNSPEDSVLAPLSDSTTPIATYTPWVTQTPGPTFTPWLTPTPDPDFLLATSIPVQLSVPDIQIDYFRVTEPTIQNRNSVTVSWKSSGPGTYSLFWSPVSELVVIQSGGPGENEIQLELPENAQQIIPITLFVTGENGVRSFRAIDFSSAPVEIGE